MRLGITGGVAEGKSTVLSYLQDLGVETVSLDDLSHRVFDEPDIQAGVASLLGMRPPISRSDLRNRLFKEPSMRRAVNRIMHPRILAAMLASPASVFEVPLLVEGCLQRYFDAIWVVTCGPDEQRRRLVERTGSEESAARVIAAQLPTAIKCIFADRIIRTNDAPQSVRSNVIDTIKRDLPNLIA